jgi:hypothetical protein
VDEAVFDGLEDSQRTRMARRNWPIQPVSSRSSLVVFSRPISPEAGARSAPEQKAALGPAAPPVTTITLTASGS